MQSGSTPDVKDNFGDLGLPNTEDLSFQLEQLVQQGVLTPEQAQAYLVESSAMSEVYQDPQTKAAQMAALQGLQDITSGGGMTAMDKQKLDQIAREEATRSRGAREAIIQNAQARGMGGSGLEIMAQLQNQQESTNRASARDTDVAAMAQARALEALQQQGQLAGQIGQQGFNQGAARAGAQDEIARFNAQNKQQVNMANTNAKNQAQQINIQNAQNVANQNVATRNQQAAQKAQIAQQQYENELRKRQAQAGIASQNAQAQGQNSMAQAQADNQMIGTLIGSGSTLGAAAMMSDERCKEEIEDFDPSDFLDSLTAYKYNYKDKKHGKGRQAGVMAQDLEKSEIGSSMVEETPEGKMINTTKATGPVLASLANINERLKKMEKGEE